MTWLRQNGDDVDIDILVQPRASRGRVAGVHGNELKVAITAPPVEGRANRALVEFIAKSLKVAKSRVSVVRGQASRHKTVRVSDCAVDEAGAALAPER